MNPLRVLLVDDETPARERLKRLLAGMDGVQVVGEARDGLEAIERIEHTAPDLVLLDVQMPGLDGFGVIQALEDPPAVIFVTAYDEYALRAFEVHALDYLLKPFSRERLEEAIHRAQDTLAAEIDPGTSLAPLLESLAAEGRYLARLAVHESDHIRVLSTDEIDWIGIEADTVQVHVGDQAYPIRRTLAELEARLDPARFFRAHRSAIVNLDRVQEIIPWFKGSHILRLTTGAEVDLSRAQARALRSILDW
ncbi:MAG: response regulator transcription factor [Anaerolineae bacterium]|nr:response regulator transcription factor [Anaerolineae bacterium]